MAENMTTVTQKNAKRSPSRRNQTIEAQKRERKQTRILQEVAKIVISTLEIQEVAGLILDQLRKVLSYGGASIQLFQGDRRILLGVRGALKEKASPTLVRNISKDPLIAKVVKSQQPLVLGDVSKEKLWEYLPETAHIKSWIGVPLVTKGEAIGLLTLDHKKAGYYTPESGKIAAAFAGQVATALLNANLFEQVRDQAQALTELNKLAQRLVAIEESADPKSVLKKIANRAKEVLKADLIELYPYRQDQDRYELPQISAGKKRVPAVQKNQIYEDDVVYKLIREPRPKYEKNSQAGTSVFTAPFTFPRQNLPEKRFVIREKIQSTAAIPLRTENESMGLMFANYRTTQAFAQEQKDLIELFARQAAIAIKNVRLYYYVNQRRKALVEVAKKLTAGSRLSEDKVLELIYEQASQLLGMENFSIALYDEATDTVRFGLASANGRRIDVEKEPGWEPRQGGNGKTEKIIHSKKYLLLPTREEVKKAGFSRISGHKDSEGGLANSWLGVPLVVGEKVLGVIATYDYGKDDYYNDEDIEILQALADQAAIAIDNSRLYFDLNLRQKALAEVAKKLTAGNRLRENEILDFIYDQAVALLCMENLSVALYDDNTKTSRVVLASENGKRVHVQDEIEEKNRRSIADKIEWIINERTYLLLSTPEEVKKKGFSPIPEYKDEVSTFANPWLGVPMFLGEKVLGVISGLLHGKANFSFEDDVEILQALADQAAIALDNTRLFERLNEVNQRQQLLVDFGNQLSTKILDGETAILTFIRDQATQFMDTKNMYIALYNEAIDEVRFGLAFKNNEPIDIPSRQAGKGRTEEIIRTGIPILITTKKASDEWYNQPGRREYIKDTLASWIGVPMKVGEKVLGVVATFHPTIDYVYSEDDLQILQAMASQVAIALENARLYKNLEEAYKNLEETHKNLEEAHVNLEKAQNEKLVAERKRAEAEKWAYLGRIAGSLAHRIGNKGGMIRLCVQDLKEYLDKIEFTDKWIAKQLDTITRNNQYLLSLSDFLFKPHKAVEEGLKETDVIPFLEDALRYAEIPDTIEIEFQYDDILPQVNGNKYLVDVFLELMINAAEAMSSSPERKLTISARQKNSRVEIEFSDTGPGIAPEDEESAYELFSLSTDRKLSQENHKGFGLWWARTFLREIGGDLRYERLPDKGATFIVELSIAEGKNDK